MPPSLQATSARGLFLGHHQASLGRSTAGHFHGRFVGGPDALVGIDSSAHQIGLQPVPDLVGEQQVRRVDQAVAQTGVRLDLIALLAELTEVPGDGASGNG